ncbi:zinc dependent phospholipase C family protein [Virgibacillus sp. MG-45]|uniref:zinc dependent phospholipase C family protein n=1 Tax=Virgibacillus sp. MG-45 TaxID=3102791 RepID=UPI002ED95769
MPNIWTHMLFCEDVIDTIGNSPDPYFKYDSMLKLGAQGPDPFFYYNFWPWIKNEPVHEIGMQLHSNHCGPFLLDLITSAKAMDKEVRAYVFGFITHHILDRNTHPYINYRAGYNSNNHQRLEVIIDTIMMEKYHNLKTWKTPVYKEINVGTRLNASIVELLHETIQKHYPDIAKSSSSYIQKAYRDMKLALKLLSDPYGWKNALLKSLVSAYSHQPVKNQVDYLNLAHTAWKHPATGEISTESFIDLYEKGRAEAIEIMTAVLLYWDSEKDIELDKIKALIGNISYDTGKPIELALENKYSEPIV